MAKKTQPAPKLRGRLRPLMISLPPELVDQIDAAAAAEHRRRTNMIEVMIRDWLAAYQQRSPTIQGALEEIVVPHDRRPKPSAASITLDQARRSA